MKKKLMSVLAIVLVIAMSVAGTYAYLTSQDEVVNTFTVGNVAITLDEAKADADGSLVADADRVKTNTYKLLPGHTYNKDPMVTVKAGSEDCYVKMTLTINNAAALDAIFAGVDGHANMATIFSGYDADTWSYQGNTKEGDTRTYTFFYKNAVPATGDNDVALKALFEKVNVPDFITGEQLATLNNFAMTINAYAVQADGFDSAAEAFAAAGI